MEQLFQALDAMAYVVPGIEGGTMFDARRTNPVPRWQRLFLYLVLSGLGATGLAWMGIHYASGGFSGENRPYALLHQLMVYHGILGYFMAVVMGGFVGQHVVAGWRARRNRATGISVIFLLTLLMGTALVLYYSGNDALRSLGSLVHQVLGVGVILAIPVHVARRLAKPERSVLPAVSLRARQTRPSLNKCTIAASERQDPAA